MKCTVLGLMSGSSLDGLDCAMVSFEIANGMVIEWHLHWATTVTMPKKFVTTLPLLSRADQDTEKLVHTDLGKWMGRQCAWLIEQYKVQPDYIASHGHTIRHTPGDGITVQIGSAEEIHKSSGVPVIYDLRAADVAAGGQGAPLAPVVERHCFPGHPFYLNLGGIANLSHHTPEGIQAWDVCPCNQLLNHLAKRIGVPYDDRGQTAAKGALLKDRLYFLHDPVTLPLHTPFSLDNAWIEKTYFPIVDDVFATTDLLHTSVEYIAQAIARQTADRSPGVHATMLITGGGAHNTYLIERLKANLPEEIEAVVPEEQIVDFKEAILMALCGALRLHRLPNAFASVTGATHDTVNGNVWPVHHQLEQRD